MIINGPLDSKDFVEGDAEAVNDAKLLSQGLNLGLASLLVILGPAKPQFACGDDLLLEERSGLTNSIEDFTILGLLISAGFVAL